MDIQDPIIITGSPRSGKTMIAGILNICGVFGGNIDKKFENRELETLLIEPYLTLNNIHSKGHVKETDTSALILTRDWKQRVHAELRRQGYSGGPWFIKSSQAAIMWPLWDYAFPNAKYLIIRRRIGDIVSSCMKTSYMNTFATEKDWIQMGRCYENLFVEMIREGLDSKIIWPHRMKYGDYQQIYESLDWLRLPWKSEILAWVDPKFFKARSKK